VFVCMYVSTYICKCIYMYERMNIYIYVCVCMEIWTWNKKRIRKKDLFLSEFEGCDFPESYLLYCDIVYADNY
jgi:hypothetical protein